jgi:hypothetical protein
MELTAVLEAVRALDGPVEVVSDSTYVVNCFRDRWWEGWLRRGWVNTAKKPVANRDLWEPLIDEYRRDPSRIRFRWVKGHSGDVMNDLVDRLAVEAAVTQAGRTGTGVPDVSPVAVAADPRVPLGRKVAVVGDGASLSPQRLADVLVAKRSMHPDLVVMTGIRSAADAADRADVPVSFVAPDGRPSTKAQIAAALRRRDDFLASHADEAIVLGDESVEWVGRLARSLRDRLGEEEVWLLEP